jgi:hypothetical protein
MREEDIRDFSAFLKEFQTETDRGAALVGAALIDQKLSDTLRSFFVVGNTAAELLDLRPDQDLPCSRSDRRPRVGGVRPDPKGAQ